MWAPLDFTDLTCQCPVSCLRLVLHAPGFYFWCCCKIPTQVAEAPWNCRFSSWDEYFLMKGGIQWVTFASFCLQVCGPCTASQGQSHRIKQPDSPRVLASLMFLEALVLLPSFTSFDPHSHLPRSNALINTQKPLASGSVSCFKIWYQQWSQKTDPWLPFWSCAVHRVDGNKTLYASSKCSRNNFAETATL